MSTHALAYKDTVMHVARAETRSGDWAAVDCVKCLRMGRSDGLHNLPTILRPVIDLFTEREAPFRADDGTLWSMVICGPAPGMAVLAGWTEAGEFHCWTDTETLAKLVLEAHEIVAEVHHPPQRVVCPECVQSKHQNCIGSALDEATDEIVDCVCDQAGHQ